MPRDRGDGPSACRGKSGEPPVAINSAVPVKRNPQPEQKLVASETLAWPHLGQNIILAALPQMALLPNAFEVAQVQCNRGKPN
jgi:hypothetical protein